MLKRTFSTVKYIEGDVKPKICRNCKYFKPDTFYFGKLRYEYGKCGKSMNIDIVTGKVYYDYASTTRKYNCKGEWFIQKEGCLFNFCK